MKSFAHASLQKIPVKISFGYPGVKIVTKQPVLLQKSLYKGKMAVQKAGKFCFSGDILYNSVTHSTAQIPWKTAVVYHTAVRVCDFGIFLCNFGLRNVTNNQFDFQFVDVIGKL